jgi:corrinoid protein of di/trimethylamine methyltransferase
LSNEEEILQGIHEAILTFNEEGLKRKINEAIKNNIAIHKILTEGLTKVAEEVGRKYEDGEFFLAELMSAGYLMEETLKLLEPLLEAEKFEISGKIVIGTVQGDLHSIGKNIVKYLLKAAGFYVYDLGVDVPSEKFVEKIEEVKPDVLAMSALLVTTMENMREVIELLKKRGLRDKVAIIIGGRPVTKEFASAIGADAYGKDAIDGLNKIKALIEQKFSEKKYINVI